MTNIGIEINVGQLYLQGEAPGSDGMTTEMLKIGKDVGVE